MLKAKKNIINSIYFLKFLNSFINKKMLNKSLLNTYNKNLKKNFNELKLKYQFLKKTQKFLISYNEVNFSNNTKKKPLGIWHDVQIYYLNDLIFTKILNKKIIKKKKIIINSYLHEITFKKQQAYKIISNKKIKKSSLLLHKNIKFFKKLIKNYKLTYKVIFFNNISFKSIKNKTILINKIKFINKSLSKKNNCINSKNINNFYFFNKLKEYNTTNNIFFNLIDNFKNNIDYNIKNIKTFSIFDYVFLNTNNLNKYYLNFYLLNLNNQEKKKNNLDIKNYFLKFKLNKKESSRDWSKADKKNITNNNSQNKKKKIIFFFSVKKGILSTFREARKVHWKFFKKSKKINSRKYTKFIFLFLKKNKHLENILQFFLFKFNLSYIFLSNFLSIYTYFFKAKINFNNIYQLPIDINFWTIIKRQKIKKLYINKKISSWIFRANKINKTFWMDKKKKSPYFLRKKPFVSNYINNNIQYDFLTNYFLILKKNNFLINQQDLIYKNKFLKLNNYKYKS